jgi:hypothetical protein
MRVSLRSIALILVVVAGCATGASPDHTGTDFDASSSEDAGGPGPEAAIESGESGGPESGVVDATLLDAPAPEDAAGGDDANGVGDGSGEVDSGRDASASEGGDAGDSSAAAEAGEGGEADGAGLIEGGSTDASTEGGTSDAGEAGEADGAVDGSAVPDSGQADAGPSIPHCPQSTSDSTGIYVTPNGADATGCGGSRGSPCLTIAGAIASTSYYSGRNIVFVGAGTYVEKVTPPSGITIMGGWQVNGSTWSFDCGAHPEGDVIVRAPASSNTTVLVDGTSGGVTLSTLTIQSKATANAGESLYGIFARGATTALTLTNVVVSMSAGGNGQTPTAAANGSGAPSTCSGGDGANAATPGTTGAGATIGTFSSAGFTPAEGALGASGSAGDNGTAAPAASPVSYASCTGTACTSSMLSCVGQPGTNGCGGGGGAGGTGGGGGGSSIALFAFDASITINGGSYTAGYGGNGSMGGAGGTGASGSVGAAGTAATCTSSTCQATIFCIANIPNNNISAPAGAAGGAGGTGSAGGQGGGGAGGDSYAVITGGAAAAALQLSNSPALAAGAPGTSLGNGSGGVASAQASF